MRIFIYNLLLFTVLLITTTARAQSERKELAEATGSISGRVTIDGKAAAGVKVIAFRRDRSYQREPVATARTDESGHYRLVKLPSYHYDITPIAPAYVDSGRAEEGLSGRAVSLAEGEIIDSFDFSLTRGGVITGRVTTADGQPVTSEHITLIQLGPKGEKRSLFDLPPNDLATDDRGIYRIFGLPPGRYLVSVGQEPESGESRAGGARYYPRTFYPGVADESKAVAVEVKAGTEATDIDIAFGEPKKTYSASGRVVDAETGKPIANARLGYGTVHEVGGSGSSSFSSGLQADDRGNFRLDGLLPGTFYVMASLGPESDLYSSVVSVQIQNQDVVGLVIKVRRGSSISGALVVEGAGDPETIAGLSRLRLWASVTSPDIVRGANNMGREAAVGPDGTFHIKGLHPGKVHLHVARSPDSKGFFISRVERGGLEQPEGIEIGPGEQVGDVRVIIGRAIGRVRGLVKIEGGKLPANAEIDIQVWRVDGPSTQSIPNVEVDPNGRFVVEDLAPAEYEIRAAIYVRDGTSIRRPAPDVRKKVSVMNGAESEVTLVVDLTEKNKGQK